VIEDEIEPEDEESGREDDAFEPEEDDTEGAPSARYTDWRLTDPTDESVERRVYVSLGSISHGSHLFDVQDNMALKDFLEGVLEYIDGILWQHAAIATDIEILAVIPRQIETVEFAARIRLALAKFLSCTRLAENDLELFRFAVREAYDVDSKTFTHERERIMKLRMAYARLCALPVGGSEAIRLPSIGRTRRKRRF
jgi:hypothetical protein